ncbi:MAG: 1-acyl-sn-glycerol-3-phosphate acyltransferase [Anaerolineales bacterium]|nr:1-acyl-sn-glycerol-3-phosphate acyltransferase [Chloroflexota bacterium]MBL6981333.1 1-acyl-sn-glycerol-3-phosphate acyltransferase [Anaerolineales bacterium]
MTEIYRPAWYVRILRPFIRALFRGVFHFISRVKVSGLDNVPKDGAYIIAINHVSLFEAPFVTAFWPMSFEVAGAADVWDRPGQGLLARLYGGIPIHRGQYDRQMLDITLSVLRSGYPLLLAPEGGRSHQPGMRRAKPGVAYLMDKAQVPVVPVGVVGSTDDFLERALRAERPTIEMSIGRPVNLPPVSGRGKARRQARQENADMVMAQIAALLPVEYRGIYAEHA